MPFTYFQFRSEILNKFKTLTGLIKKEAKLNRVELHNNILQLTCVSIKQSPEASLQILNFILSKNKLTDTMTDIKYDFRWPCINDSQRYHMFISENFSNRKIVHPRMFSILKRQTGKFLRKMAEICY